MTTTHPSGVTPRRRIEFLPKMQEQFKERILAVAWITAQQPGRVYEAPNVTRSMAAALAKAGYRVPISTDQGHPHRPLVTSMRWLEDHGYGLRSLSGKMHTGFMLDADVQVPTPPFVRVRQAREAATEQHAASEIAEGYHRAMASASRADKPLPPLPGAPTSPPWLERLDAAVTAWWRSDPEAANRWAVAAITAMDERS
jgi:hypothetical protein